MPRRLCLLTLHPATGSFNHALAQAYAEGAARAGHALARHDLATMTFDPDFGRSDYRGAPRPEPDLAAFLADLRAADHLVLVAPMWWGGLPARAKGLFDRAFLPGIAFDPRHRRHGLPQPLLAGRSARLILTSDTPGWAFRLLYGQALRRQLARQVLGFAGIAPMAMTHLSPVERSTPAIRAAWLARVAALGARAA